MPGGGRTLCPASPARTRGSEIVTIGKGWVEGQGREVTLCQMLGRALCLERLMGGDWGRMFPAHAAPGPRTCLRGRSGARLGPRESGHVSEPFLFAPWSRLAPPERGDCHLLPGP